MSYLGLCIVNYLLTGIEDGLKPTINFKVRIC